MRKLDRSAVAVPPSLHGPSAAVAGEKKAAAAYYAARSPWKPTDTAFTFAQYKSPDVKGALYQLSGGNCAYCESKIASSGAREVEHYRPKGGIDDVKTHPGYWWLTHTWENLLPTCPDCNKSRRQYIVSSGMTIAQVEALMGKRASKSHGKANQFEVLGVRAADQMSSLGDEDPLLIDPCVRDPAGELQWDFNAEVTLMEPRPVGAGYSRYGAYTIKVCALNRAGLVLGRIPALRPMRLIRTRIEDRLNNWADTQADFEYVLTQVEMLAVFSQPDQPHAGMAAAFIDEIMQELDDWRIARGLPPF